MEHYTEEAVRAVLEFTPDPIERETLLNYLSESPIGDEYGLLPENGWDLIGDKVPYYSTDISSAFKVVEEMRRRGFDVEIVCRAFWNIAWLCIFSLREGQRNHLFDGNGDTVPLAICKAAPTALEAVTK